jgi:predicted aminopeptidase
MARLLVAAALCLWLGGCANVAYYAQAVEGESEVLSAAHPIGDLVADPGTDPALRRQLEQVNAMRDFASHDLALPDNGSYRSYASLARPYVVWNVFAAPALSLEPKQWCLLFVGCVSYRGYFDQRDAEKFADGLKRRGFDTYVAGIPAYSTLGLFDDPVLDTFLRLGDQTAARIIFHELAHQLIYVRGDTSFNESFAVAVEQEGLRRWLAHGSSAGQLRDLATQEVRQAQFERLIDDCRERLRAIYASSLPEAAKLQAKEAAYAGLRQAYARLKAEAWSGYAGYDHRMAQPLNNAELASMSLYTRWLPSFRALLAEEHGDLPRFYQRVAALAKLPKPARSAILAGLAESGTASMPRHDDVTQSRRLSSDR